MQVLSKLTAEEELMGQQLAKWPDWWKDRILMSMGKCSPPPRTETVERPASVLVETEDRTLAAGVLLHAFSLFFSRCTVHI